MTQGFSPDGTAAQGTRAKEMQRQREGRIIQVTKSKTFYLVFFSRFFFNLFLSVCCGTRSHFFHSYLLLLLLLIIWCLYLHSRNKVDSCEAPICTRLDQSDRLAAEGGGREGKVGVAVRRFRSPESHREKQEVHFTALTAEEAGGRGARRVRSSRRPLNAAFRGEGRGVGGGGWGRALSSGRQQGSHFTFQMPKADNREESGAGAASPGEAEPPAAAAADLGGGDQHQLIKSLCPPL